MYDLWNIMKLCWNVELAMDNISKFNIIQAYSMLTQFIHLYRPQFCHSGVRQATVTIICSMEKWRGSQDLRASSPHRIIVGESSFRRYRGTAELLRRWILSCIRVFMQPLWHLNVSSVSVEVLTTTSSRLVSPCAARSPFQESVDVSVVDGNISLHVASLLWFSVLVTRCFIGWPPGQCSDRSLCATTNFELSRACWVLVNFGRLLLLMNLVELIILRARIMLNNSSGACVSCDKLSCD